ncbi:MAG: nucleoside-diphosphate kinase [Candidatus Aenigmatarchaeota archaeon]
MGPRLLLLYKPLSVKYDILMEHLDSVISPEATYVAKREWKALPPERVSQLYWPDHGDKPYFGNLCGMISGKPTTTFVLQPRQKLSCEKEQRQWVEFMRNDKIGYKDPAKAKPGSFRWRVPELIQGYDYAAFDHDNGLHFSDSVEAGEREGGIFFWDWPLNKKLVSNPEALKEGSPLLEVAKMGKGIFLEERVNRYLLENGLVDAETLEKTTSISAFKGPGGKGLLLSIEIEEGYDTSTEYIVNL